MENQVGVALSGGGVIAFLAATCQLYALRTTTYQHTINHTATTSGGTLAAMLHQNKQALAFPPHAAPTRYGPNAHQTLAKRYGDAHTPWFAAVVDVLADVTKGSHAAAADDPRLDDLKRHGRSWDDLLRAAMLLYRIDPEHVRAPSDAWSATISLLRSRAAPIVRDAEGFMAFNATLNLLHATLNFKQGATQLRPHSVWGPPPQEVDLWDSVSASGAFWAANIVELPPFEFRLARGVLPRLRPPDDEWYLLDGGVIDALALSPLLRRRVSTVIAFVNVPEDLHAVSGQLASYFGIRNHTLSTSMLEGPELAQVFPSELWETVYGGLLSAEPSVHLQNVSVRANAYLEVQAYQLDSLIVLSSQRSEAFLAEMDAVDPLVRARLHPGWPAAMPLEGMSNLDANTMCVYNQWSVDRMLQKLESRTTRDAS